MKQFYRIAMLSASLLISTPFLVVDFLYRPYITTRIILWSCALAALIIVTMMRARRDVQFSERIVNLVQHPVVIVFALFIGWIFVRSIPTMTPELWWGSLNRTDGVIYYIGWLMAAVSISAWNSDEKNRAVAPHIARIFAWVAFLTTLISAIWVLIQRYGHDVEFVRFAGSVGNPLYLAGMLLFVPWAAYYINNRFVRWLIIGVAAIALFATETRGAFLAALIMIFVYTACISYMRGKKYTLAIVSLVVGGALVATITGLYINRVNTIESRLALWRVGISELRASPLIGFGLGKHSDVIDRATVALKTVTYSDMSDTTHSGFIDLALQGGIIAVLLLLVWISMTIRMIMTNTMMSVEARARSTATIVGYFVFAATSFFATWIWIPFALLIGVFLHPLHKRQVPFAVPIFMGLGTIVVVSAAILCFMTIYHASYVKQIDTAMVQRRYANLPQHRMYAPQWSPYAKEYMVETLRLTIPNAERAIVPSFDTFVQNNAVDMFSAISSLTYRHPQDDYIGALWASSFAQSGMTSQYNLWHQKAIDLQLHTLSINPDRPQTIFQLADAYREKGRAQESLQILKEFTERNPMFAEGHLFYGLMLDLTGDKVAAKQQALTALKIKAIDYWLDEHGSWLKEASNY